MDLTLKSAADFMEDHKHFLVGCRETGTQTWARSTGRKLSKGFKFFFLKLTRVFTDVLGYQQTSWAFGGHMSWRKGKQGKQHYYQTGYCKYCQNIAGQRAFVSSG